ncbi:hypothetical protein NQ318_010253 [Aromia moschata]|uniref:TOG domain-containing protein n=1 Tax=Aromia moschata TaxID=1265417 RepID=A0AAV8YIX9_9CUCU|nr:hypothetical protein NQ318_010253 [Aromia moschata]
MELCTNKKCELRHYTLVRILGAYKDVRISTYIYAKRSAIFAAFILHAISVDITKSHKIHQPELGFGSGVLESQSALIGTVSSNGIEVLTYLIDRLGSDFRPYLPTVLPNVVDRLGDAKDTVREKSQLLILKLLERNVLTPQTLIERLQPCFTHKNAKIREEVLRCLVNTLNEHGAHSLTLNRFIPDIVNLLSDPTATVRDTAFNTLVDLYKHVGDKLRIDLQRRNIVPQSKWPHLAARFDEAKSRESCSSQRRRALTSQMK